MNLWQHTVPTLKAFLAAHSHSVSICYWMPKKYTCICDLMVTWKQIFHPPSPSPPVILASTTLLAIVPLCNSRFNFHCHTQLEATPTHKTSPKKAAATICDFLQNSFPELPNTLNTFIFFSRLPVFLSNWSVSLSHNQWCASLHSSVLAPTRWQRCYQSCSIYITGVCDSTMTIIHSHISVDMAWIHV